MKPNIVYAYILQALVIIPKVAKAEAGFYVEIHPVGVHPPNDYSTIVSAISTAIEGPQPVVATPTRAIFPKPIVLECAKVRSWRAFEKKARGWNIIAKDNVYEIQPYGILGARGVSEGELRVVARSVSCCP